MKKFAYISATILAIAATGAALAGDKHKVVTQDLDLNGFDRIDVSGVYELDVEVGKKFSVELSGPESEMVLVETSVKDGVLHLDQREATRKEKRHWGKSREGIDARITLPSLVAIDVSGVVEGSVANIDSKEFKLNISGVGDLELDGDCGSLDAKVSGVGDLDADALECRVVAVKVSGVGDASVFASEEVDARVSGMGDIDVYGSPEKVETSDSMFAEITVH